MTRAAPPDTRRLYVLLAVLFTIACASQVLFTVDAVRDLTGSYPLGPVYLNRESCTVGEYYYGPKGADVKVGDRLAAVDGRPVASVRDYLGAVRVKEPGRSLRLAFYRKGTTREYEFHLHAVFDGGAPASFWFFAIVSWILMPWLALAVGYYVTAVRPTDKRAWMALGILAGFSQVYRPGILSSLAWPEWVGIPAAFYQVAAAVAWAPCMMLFGFYFPHRWRLDRKAPWVKWLVLAPALVPLVSELVRDGSAIVSIAAAAAVPRIEIPDSVTQLLIMAMISLFFISLANQYRDPALHADDRRRLKLLYWGCTAAMTPMFLLFLYTTIRFHREPGDRDGVWLMIGILTECLFPITMGYVIVVQQAMPVRMVVRQGVQYALARQGITAIQVAVTAVAIWVAVTMAASPEANRPRRILFLAAAVLVAMVVRRRAQQLQRWVDRRFFREAYDAEQILGELSEQVRGILDRDSLLQTLTRKLSESLHVERIAVMLRSGGGFRPALATGYPAPPDVSFDSATGIVARLLHTREPVRVTEGEEGGPDAGALERLQAQLLLPLASRKELLGFISLGPKRSEEPYSAGDTRLLRTVAAQTGLALENSRLSEAIASEVAQRELLNREIEIAREVQQRLFPQNLPEVPALEYAGHCRPARGVGGDYYDFLALSSGRLGLAIGDVSGKGVPAALLMASLQASVRGQSQASGRVADLMSGVNKLVCDASPENRYATFFYAEFDPATRKLVYTNGGHNPPMLLRGGEVLRLENGGPPVGLFPMSRYEQDEVVLEPGDLLVLFTDGISEAENTAEDEWGEEALIAAVRSCSAAPPSEMIARILEAADKFVAGAPQHDDMTLVVARSLTR